MRVLELVSVVSNKGRICIIGKFKPTGVFRTQTRDAIPYACTKKACILEAFMQIHGFPR